jgi:hypothetical protein
VKSSPKDFPILCLLLLLGATLLLSSSCTCGGSSGSDIFVGSGVKSFDEQGREYVYFIGNIFSKKVTSHDSNKELTETSRVSDFITKNLYVVLWYAYPRKT